MSKKTAAMRKKITELLKNIDDEAVLGAMLVFANSATTPEKLAELKSTITAPKPKTRLTAPIDSRVLEYQYNNKPMLAIQTSAKPDEAVIAKFKSLHLRFYSANVPTNPFGNALPFWAGQASAATKEALMSIA